MSVRYQGVLAAIACTLLLSSCATMIRGTEQQVSVNTNPIGADVAFSNGQSCTSPCNLKSKRDQSLVITISRAGCQTQTASMVPMLAGAGVVLGGLIDYGTGAVYDLQPNPLTVTLACDPAFAAQPRYQTPTPAPAPTYTYSQPPHPAYQPPATYEAEPAAPVQAYQPPTIRAQPAIAPYNPPQAALGRPAPKDDFWDRPHNAPAVDRSVSATPEPVTYPIDPCTAYQNDNIARVRCEWITGPQRAEYVPPAGEGAPLDVQISCLPVRDRSQQYGNCIAQGYL